MTMLRRIRLVLISLAVVVGLQPVVAVHAATPPGGGAPSGSIAVARARVATEVLLDSYDEQKAWFPSSWWNSAVALQTMGDYMLRTGDRSYVDELDHSFETNKGPFPAGERSTDEIYGNFTSRAIDDAGWWALNWVTAYDLTGDQKYLDMAGTIADFMHGFWDPSTCGGGIWWNEERTYKNAVTNGQWIRLTAELHNRIPGDTAWLERAQEAWDWYAASGMVNSEGLVNDGLTDDCANNRDTVWSYNQGLGIGAALELHRATGDAELLSTARDLADAALASDALVTDGVLTESCDPLGRTCDDNQKQFKGIFLRYFTELADTTTDPRYDEFVDRQAESIWANDRDSAERLGLRWAGASTEASPNVFDWRTQASALSALIADVPQDAPSRSLSATMAPTQLVVMPSPGTTSSVRTAVEVAATSDGRPVRADVRVSGPDGWTVDPARSRVRLAPSGDGSPARASVPLDVTVPADARDGSYPLTVTVTARPGLGYTTRVTVQVASTIDFDAGSTEELAWLWDAGGSGLSHVGSRFADGTSHFVYKFPFPAEATSAEATLTIDNQYVVEVGPDGESWTTVLAEDEPIRDGSNKADHTLDLTPYLGPDKAVYLRVTDAFPEDGWGGGVYHVSAQFGTL
ncbi:glycoside hydrolase family 76 protein [Promicromonospora iranensis]|uniref:Alpha-1,6-mannanase (GH76 family) n=1 Tax=Promicromonospora iranensis TaxID=1105144 RepID=A0ABU2CHD3_9MICO|nr:glycoside hydrolase family 76 protein [Promicromonospora iranensis]MDR7380736.1 putative alpha-1,6-mannanase (GH76 family) [Promicromonospora iranensis]